MSEVIERFFQIDPTATKGDGGRCQFMNDCFNLEDIIHISPVVSLAVQLYEFNVTLEGLDEKLCYQFARKETAIKAQRCISDAYTGSGRYKYDTRTVPTT